VAGETGGGWMTFTDLNQLPFGLWYLAVWSVIPAALAIAFYGWFNGLAKDGEGDRRGDSES